MKTTPMKDLDADMKPLSNFALWQARTEMPDFLCDFYSKYPRRPGSLDKVFEATDRIACADWMGTDSSDDIY